MPSKITWSFFREEDEAERRALHDELEKRAGRELDRPDLMREPVLAAVVGRVKGNIKHVIFIEAEAEVQASSANVLTPQELAVPVGMLMEVIQAYRLRVVRAFVPTQMLKLRKGRKAAIARMLERIGFVQEDPTLISQFHMWLGEAKSNSQVA